MIYMTYGRSSWDDPDSPVLAVLPPKAQQDRVWHYTKARLARSIVESDAFWATSIATMNDGSEMLFGMTLVRAFWEAHRDDSENRERIDRWIEVAELMLLGERRSDSYVLCASTTPNSIAQWDRYGHCVLGIATDPLMTKVSLSEDAGGRIGPTFTTGWRPVIYDESAQREHVATLIGVLEGLCAVESWQRTLPWREADDAGVECVLRSIVYLKPAEWSFEAEVRLYGQARPTGARVERHESAFGPSSHILVRAQDAGNGVDSLPIVAIWFAEVSPIVAGQVETMKHLADRKLPAATVELVATTFRKMLDAAES